MTTDSALPEPDREVLRRTVLDEVLALLDHHRFDPADLLSLSTELQSIAVDRLVARATGGTPKR
jgi:hypothetical protein